MVLAYVFCLNQAGVDAKAVSDDGGLGWLADETDIPIIRSLGLVHRMFVSEKLAVAKIKSMAGYLHYINDLPKDWRIKGEALFGASLP